MTHLKRWNRVDAIIIIIAGGLFDFALLNFTASGLRIFPFSDIPFLIANNLDHLLCSGNDTITEYFEKILRF
jgi:hypothetical protein